MSPAAAMTVLLLALPSALPAQRLTSLEPARATLLVTQGPQDPAAYSEPSRGRLVAGSALGASVGALAGWTAGVLVVVATHGNTDNLNDAFATAAVAVLAGSAGAIVLGGVGSRIGVRAAGGDGGPLGKHILASLAGWGASTLLLSAIYNNSSNNDPNTGTVFTLLIGTHGLVTALLAPKR